MTTLLDVRHNRPTQIVKPMIRKSGIKREENQLKKVKYNLDINKTNTFKRNQQKPRIANKLSTLYNPNNKPPEYTHDERPILLSSIILAHVGLLIFAFWGLIQDLLRLYVPDRFRDEAKEPKDTIGFSKLYQTYAPFFTRNMYSRERRCWNSPICSVPGRLVDLMVRESDGRPGWDVSMKVTKKVQKATLNLSSYNYLGFADTDGACADDAVKYIQNSSYAPASSEKELGRSTIHKKFETRIAEFLAVEDAMIFGMGFATNSMNIPRLVDKKSLIISDENNHSSIVTGCRLSGATIRVFKHNNMESLEHVLKRAILYGNPKRANRAFNKILIIIEGIYSMEGTICNLPEIVSLKEKYKAYLYLDEAHSIGALGKHGRGVCDYFNIDAKRVDIMMGTFTKSFGAAGGYIAGSSKIISHLRQKGHGACYANTMPPPVVGQAMKALDIIDYDKFGNEKINQLADNARYFRFKLKKMGYYVYGHDDSPVVPMLICDISKLTAFYDLAKLYGLCVVVVALPATPLAQGRCRFCLSASHSRDDMDRALKIINIIGEELSIKY